MVTTTDTLIPEILKYSSDGILAFDMDFNYTFWNPVMERLIDKKAEEVIGKNAFEMFPFLIDLGFDKYYYSALQGKTITANEKVFNPPAGKIINIEVVSMPHKNTEGNIIGGIHIIKDFTTQITAEEQLRFNNLILENVTDSIIVTDLEGKVTYWNKGAEQIFQYTKEEVSGKNIEFLNIENSPSFKEYFDQINTNIEYKQEWQGRRKDGSHVWILPKTTALKDNNGDTIGYIGVSKDITDRIENQQKLIRSESRYRKLMESAPAAIIVIQDNKIVFANNAAAHLVKADHLDQLYSMQLMDFIHPNSKENVINRITAVMAGEEVTVSEHKIFDLKGNITEIESIGSLIDYEGKLAIQVIMHDITDRNRAIAALKANEERITKITNEIPGTVFQLYAKEDGSNHIEFISKSIRTNIPDIENYKVIEDIYPFIYSEDLEGFKVSVKKALINKSNWDHEFRYTYNNEISWVRGTAAVDRVDDNTLKYTGFLKDINERKQIEQEIKRKNEKLNQLTQHLENIRDEEKRKISREIHDGIGQELTGIKLELFWLKKKIAEIDKYNEYPFISKKVEDLIEIVGNTIENSRRLAYELRPVLLDNLGLIPALEWLINNFSNLNNINCQTNLNIKDIELSQVATNTIFRIFQETLHNITKYAEATKVHISIVTDDENIYIDIKDNGVGIKVNDLEQSNNFGLFNIKERVSDFNGEFNLYTKQGKGTEIEISLPITNISKDDK